MKQFNNLDPLLHSQLRLAIVSILVSVERAEFNYLKEQTEATSGNLSVQIDKLAQAGYITVKKSFRGKKPVTTCTISPKGLRAFEKYVNDINQYISK